MVWFLSHLLEHWSLELLKASQGLLLLENKLQTPPQDSKILQSWPLPASPSHALVHHLLCLLQPALPCMLLSLASFKPRLVPTPGPLHMLLLLPDHL
jgi:hypothetical protein